MTVNYIRYTPLLMMDMKDVWEAYIVNHAVHPNCLSLEHISYIFEGRNPKPSCGCKCGQQSVTYHFGVTWNLTSSLSSRTTVS